MHFNSNLKHGFDLRIDMPDTQGAQGARREAAARGVAVLPAWKPFRDPARIWLNSAAGPSGAADADMSGTYFAEQAVEYLRGEARQAVLPDRELLRAAFAVSLSRRVSRPASSPEQFTVPKSAPTTTTRFPPSSATVDRRRRNKASSPPITLRRSSSIKNVGLVLRRWRSRGRRTRYARASTPAITATCSASMAASRSTAVSSRRSARRC